MLGLLLLRGRWHARRAPNKLLLLLRGLAGGRQAVWRAHELRRRHARLRGTRRGRAAHVLLQWRHARGRGAPKLLLRGRRPARPAEKLLRGGRATSKLLLGWQAAHLWRRRAAHHLLRRRRAAHLWRRRAAHHLRWRLPHVLGWQAAHVLRRRLPHVRLLLLVL